MRQFFVRLVAGLIIVGLVVALALPVAAHETGHSAWSGDRDAPTRLIVSGVHDAGGGGFWAAVEIRIMPGWYLYAHQPGSDGAGLTIDVVRSDNVAGVFVLWPAVQPAAQNVSGQSVLSGDVVIPVRVQPRHRDRDVVLEVKLTYAVCGEICRPAETTHRLRIAGGAATSQQTTPESETIKRALDQIPGSALTP